MCPFVRARFEVIHIFFPAPWHVEKDVLIISQGKIIGNRNNNMAMGQNNWKQE